MTALDILHGRGGGRRLPAGRVLPGTILWAKCDCTWWRVVPSTVGQPCWGCGAPILAP